MKKHILAFNLLTAILASTFMFTLHAHAAAESDVDASKLIWNVKLDFIYKFEGKEFKFSSFYPTGEKRGIALFWDGPVENREFLFAEVRGDGRPEDAEATGQITISPFVIIPGMSMGRGFPRILIGERFVFIDQDNKLESMPVSLTSNGENDASYRIDLPSPPISDLFEYDGMFWYLGEDGVVRGFDPTTLRPMREIKLDTKLSVKQAENKMRGYKGYFYLSSSAELPNSFSVFDERGSLLSTDSIYDYISAEGNIRPRWSEKDDPDLFYGFNVWKPKKLLLESKHDIVLVDLEIKRASLCGLGPFASIKASYLKDEVLTIVAYEKVEEVKPKDMVLLISQYRL